MRTDGSNDRVQMTLFDWLLGSRFESAEHVMLNVAMFVPFGLLCFMIPEYAHLKSCLLLATSAGLTYSVIIETAQLLLKRGTCDIDDMVANACGAFLGAFFMLLVQRIFNKRY